MKKKELFAALMAAVAVTPVGVASQLKVTDRLALKGDIRGIKAWGNDGTLTGTFRDQTQDIALH